MCAARPRAPDRRAAGTPARSLSGEPVFRCDVAPAATRRGAGGFHPQLELVFLAVENGGREPERVQAMQFLRDARERGCEVVRFLQLEIAAAGLVGQLAQAPVGPCSLQADAVEELGLEADR